MQAPFRKLAFSETNERRLRTALFASWELYFAKRRYRSLLEMRGLKDTSPRYHELSNCRFVQTPAPSDLSGACKIVSQVALQVFDLRGRVVSNPLHTFVQMESGEPYDLNRGCRDVGEMRCHPLGERVNPYRIPAEYTDSPPAIKGRESWARFIDTFLTEFAERVQQYDRVAYHSGPGITRLPEWCKVSREPRRVFAGWAINLVEV